MTREEFNKKLENAVISKSEFCERAGLYYPTVNGWGSNNKSVPIWVESWLDNYQKAKLYEKLKEKVFEIEGIEV